MVDIAERMVRVLVSSPVPLLSFFSAAGREVPLSQPILVESGPLLLLLFFVTLVAGPGRSWSLELSDARVYAHRCGPLSEGDSLRLLGSFRHRNLSGPETVECGFRVY